MSALQVSDRQVRRWIAQACPCRKRARKGGGRPIITFDVLEVKRWLVDRGIAPTPAPRPKSADAQIPEAAPASAEQGQPYKEPQGQSGEDVRKPGYTGMIERLRLAERATFASWTKAINERDITGIIGLRRAWIETSEQLRKVEKDAGAVRRNDGDWILRADVVAAFSRIGSEIKLALLAIPRSIAPRVVGASAPEIEAVIATEIHGCLALLAQAKIERKETGRE